MDPSREISCRKGRSLYFQATGMKLLRVPKEKAEQLRKCGKRQVIHGIRPEDLPEAACPLPGRQVDTLVEVTEHDRERRSVCGCEARRAGA